MGESRVGGVAMEGAIGRNIVSVKKAESLNISVMINAARLAATYLVDVANNSATFDSNRKSDNTWVLSLDLECNTIIRKCLSDILPIVSEEEEATHTLIGSKESYFLVDPIDGTSACRRYLKEIGGQVGFGPLIGQVVEGKLVSAVFAHVPWRTLFYAEANKGIICESFDGTTVNRLFRPNFNKPLNECATLYFMGTGREATIVNHLKHSEVIDNGYRFGGFANDCSRLARGFEELLIQFSVKAWDFSASLFLEESGFETILDPLGERVSYSNWEVQHNNPLIACSPLHSERMIYEINRCGLNSL
jgi:fructose-1,6-bisphosphatase/inositol monophosphatase family enzyme